MIALKLNLIIFSYSHYTHIQLLRCCSILGYWLRPVTFCSLYRELVHVCCHKSQKDFESYINKNSLFISLKLLKKKTTVNIEISSPLYVGHTNIKRLNGICIHIFFAAAKCHTCMYQPPNIYDTVTSVACTIYLNKYYYLTFYILTFLRKLYPA